MYLKTTMKIFKKISKLGLKEITYILIILAVSTYLFNNFAKPVKNIFNDVTYEVTEFFTGDLFQDLFRSSPTDEEVFYVLRHDHYQLNEIHFCQIKVSIKKTQGTYKKNKYGLKDCGHSMTMSPKMYDELEKMEIKVDYEKRHNRKRIDKLTKVLFEDKRDTLWAFKEQQQQVLKLCKLYKLDLLGSFNKCEPRFPRGYDF